MDDQDPLRSQIGSARRYKELLSLRDTVWSLSAKVDFSTYVDLRKRVDERISEFEKPQCDDIEIKIIYPSAKPSLMDLRECRIAIGKGPTFPKYVFSKYKDAVDIEILPLGIQQDDDSAKSTKFDPRKHGKANAQFNPKLGILQNRIEKVIKLASYMNETYSTVIPKISADLHEIVVKLEDLYRKVSDNEYELRE